eukprot:1194999-Prorocentrum_minimum.AAC.6
MRGAAVRGTNKLVTYITNYVRDASPLSKGSGSSVQVEWVVWSQWWCKTTQVQRSLRYLKKQIPDAMLQQLAEIGQRATENSTGNSRQKAALRQAPHLSDEVRSDTKLRFPYSTDIGMATHYPGFSRSHIWYDRFGFDIDKPDCHLSNLDVILSRRKFPNQSDIFERTRDEAHDAIDALTGGGQVAGSRCRYSAAHTSHSSDVGKAGRTNDQCRIRAELSPCTDLFRAIRSHTLRSPRSYPGNLPLASHTEQPSHVSRSPPPLLPTLVMCRRATFTRSISQATSPMANIPWLGERRSDAGGGSTCIQRSQGRAALPAVRSKCRSRRSADCIRVYVTGGEYASPDRALKAHAQINK